jgi:hypothetical protein
MEAVSSENPAEALIKLIHHNTPVLFLPWNEPGTQSSYLAAMDERIHAASIACYMSTFQVDREWVASGQSDGEQTWSRAYLHCDLLPRVTISLPYCLLVRWI